MKERLRKKIDLLTKYTCWDHHKSRDGYYNIEARYNAFSQDFGFVPVHDGYLWEYYGKSYPTYEEAEEALEKAVDKSMWEELKWFRRGIQDDEDYDLEGSPIRNMEEWEKVKQEYKALCDT